MKIKSKNQGWIVNSLTLAVLVFFLTPIYLAFGIRSSFRELKADYEFSDEVFYIKIWRTK